MFPTPRTMTSYMHTAFQWAAPLIRRLRSCRRSDLDESQELDESKAHESATILIFDKVKVSVSKLDPGVNSPRELYLLSQPARKPYQVLQCVLKMSIELFFNCIFRDFTFFAEPDAKRANPCSLKRSLLSAKGHCYTDYYPFVSVTAFLTELRVSAGR